MYWCNSIHHQYPRGTQLLHMATLSHQLWCPTALSSHPLQSHCSFLPLPGTVIYCTHIQRAKPILGSLTPPVTQTPSLPLTSWKSVTQKIQSVTANGVRTLSFLHHNSYLNEFIFNPTENSMKLSKISEDQKWNSLCEKIRDTVQLKII